MEHAFAELQGEEPDADVASLAAQLGRLHIFRSGLELASERIETALEIAESLWLPEVLAHALISKGLIANWRSRPEEALGLTQRGLALALEYELPAAGLRAFNNVGDLLHRRDRCEEATTELEQGLALARRIGDRGWEVNLLSELSWALAQTGRWQEALACVEQVPEEQLAETLGSFLIALPEPLVARGKLDEARRLLFAHIGFETSADVQRRTCYHAAQAVVLRAEGKEREALVAAEEALAVTIEELGPTTQQVKVAFPQALEAALALGERERAEQLLDQVEAFPPGRLAPNLRGHAARFRARLATADGHGGEAEAKFAAAAATFREFGMGFLLAVTLLEHGEWLAGQARTGEAEQLVLEARAIFEALEAKPWLERLEAVQTGPRAEVPA
jgi:tetratricopeptide (TPR) repeat protein